MSVCENRFTKKYQKMCLFVYFWIALRVVWCETDLWTWGTTGVGGWQGCKLHQEARLSRVKVCLDTLCSVWYFKVWTVQRLHWTRCCFIDWL